MCLYINRLLPQVLNYGLISDFALVTLRRITMRHVTIPKIVPTVPTFISCLAFMWLVIVRLVPNKRHSTMGIG
jgi:hypothetical protein